MGSATTLVEQPKGYGPPAPVPVFQWEIEFSALLHLYRQRQPKRILEIGTYHGGTLYHWLQNATPGARIVSVDSYEVKVDNRALYPAWVPEGVELEVVVGDSSVRNVITEVAKHAPYDWIFIDAGHYYAEVAADWHNYKGMCEKGGVVVFHDILPPSRTWPIIEVFWLWKELKRAGYKTEEIVHDRDAEWGGLGIVYL